MKFILTLISAVGLVAFTTINDGDKYSNNELYIDSVVFDGYEGNIFFFTNSQEESITIDDADNTLLSELDFEANDYIGKTFKLSLKLDKKKGLNFVSKDVIEVKLL
jgi:hypothetical protein